MLLEEKLNVSHNKWKILVFKKSREIEYIEPDIRSSPKSGIFILT